MDKLDGGAGTDTLKIVQAAAVNTTTVVPPSADNMASYLALLNNEPSHASIPSTV